MTLGERIQKLRKTTGLSQEQLAELVGVSRQAISKWETDQSAPELENILLLSKAFSVSTDELLGNEVIRIEAVKNGKTQDSHVQKYGLTTQKVLGIVLVCMSFLVFMFFTFLFGSLFYALIYTSPIIPCAVICLTIKKYAGLWCAWSLYIIIYAYLRYATTIKIYWIFNSWVYRPEMINHAIIAWVETLVLAVLLFITGYLLWGKNKRSKK